MKFFTALILMLISLSAAADIYDDIGKTAENKGTPKETAAKLTEKMRSEGYSKETAAIILEALNTDIGMSAVRISEKVLEGIAKKVPQQNVANAALKVKARYEIGASFAKKAGIKGKAADNTADIAADALAAGAAEKTLVTTAKQISEIRQDREKYAVSVLALYRDMLRYGVKESYAADVAAVSVNKLSADQINEYRHEFMKNAGSLNADALAKEMKGHMSHGRGPSSMSSGHGESGSGQGGSGGSGGGKR